MTLKDAKKIYITFVAAIAVSGFFTVCTLGRALQKRRTETKLAAVSVSDDSPEFMVCESGGRAAVFRKNEEAPYLLIDVDLALLSDYDREALSEGLYFRNERELRQFIEDISS